MVRRTLRRLEPFHVLWLVFWAPWWVGNELPPPVSPGTREADMVELPQGTAGAWLLDTLDDLRFRFGLTWTAALVLRGAWLGGLVGVAWLILAMLTDLTTPSIRRLAILVGMGIVLGVVLRTFHRPRYGTIAMLLERSFDLRSRLTTAVAALRYGKHGQGSLHELQLADAANALNRCRALLRPGHWVPIREIFIVFIVATTMLLLLVARRPEGEIPPASTAGLPGFVPVSERLAAAEQQPPPVEAPDAATLQEVEDISRTSNQARQDLEAIGNALDEHAVTSPAASAIANEDYEEANRQLSDASEQVVELPADDREALADELDEAADRVSDDNPELANAAREAADDVRAGEDTGALDDLGEQIEETGESVVSQQPTGGDLSESSAQQGDAQSGAPGGSASSPGDRPEPAEGGGGESQAGSEGEPGAGMDASGGVGSSDQMGEQSGSSGTGEDSGDSPNSSGGGAPVDETQEGDASGSGQGESSETSGDGSAESGNMTGRPNEEDGEAQGSGAGGGQQNANDPSEGDQSGDGGGNLDNEDEAPEAGDGEAGDPPPGGPEDEGREGSETIAGGGSSIMLPGTSSERVSSGSDVGSSSVGSGGGVGAGSGDSTTSVSGSSGPDPNDVPARWRTIVEDYFRDGGAP